MTVRLSLPIPLNTHCIIKAHGTVEQSAYESLIGLGAGAILGGTLGGVIGALAGLATSLTIDDVKWGWGPPY